MRIEILVKKLEISTSIEIPDIRTTMRDIRIDINHTTQPPELYNLNSIRSRHRISIGYYEEEGGRRKEIGTIDCSIMVLVSHESTDEIQKIFDIWSYQEYNMLPLDVRVAIETNISLAVLPVIGIIAEKARLPPPIPPFAFSPRPVTGGNAQQY